MPEQLVFKFSFCTTRLEKAPLDLMETHHPKQLHALLFTIPSFQHCWFHYVGTQFAENLIVIY